MRAISRYAQAVTFGALVGLAWGGVMLYLESIPRPMAGYIILAASLLGGLYVWRHK
jgi:hypothetical protein